MYRACFKKENTEVLRVAKEIYVDRNRGIGRPKKGVGDFKWKGCGWLSFAEVEV